MLLVGQEAIGHWLFTQHSVVAMPSETETLTKSSSRSVFVQDLHPQSGGQAECSQWVTIHPTPLVVHVNMHVVLYVHVHVIYDSLNSVLTSLSLRLHLSVSPHSDQLSCLRVHRFSESLDRSRQCCAQGCGFLRQDLAAAVVLSWSR